MSEHRGRGGRGASWGACGEALGVVGTPILWDSAVMFPWELAERAGTGGWPLVTREGQWYSQTLLPQWRLLADPARAGHQLAGAALAAGTGQRAGPHPPQRPPLLHPHGALGAALPEPPPSPAAQCQPAGGRVR